MSLILGRYYKDTASSAKGGVYQFIKDSEKGLCFKYISGPREYPNQDMDPSKQYFLFDDNDWEEATDEMFKENLTKILK